MLRADLAELLPEILWRSFEKTGDRSYLFACVGESRCSQPALQQAAFAEHESVGSIGVGRRRFGVPNEDVARSCKKWLLLRAPHHERDPPAKFQHAEAFAKRL